MIQIVGKSSGVSNLLSVDSSGRVVVKDADNITQTTAINTKLSAIDAVLDNSLVQQTACATDLAALEVLQTSTNAVLSTIETSNAAIKTAVEGTLSVSAPAISTTSTVLENATSVVDSATETTPSVDVGAVRRVAFFGSLDDGSAVIKVEVSADNSTFYENTEQAIYLSSDNFFRTIDIDARYVRLKYTNSSGAAKTWTAIASYKA